MPQSFEDVKYQALGRMGYMGTLNEREYAFYASLAAGGGFPVPDPVNAGDAANKGYVDSQANPAPAQRNSTATLTAAQFGTSLVDATAAAVVLTLPTAASATGRIFTIKKVDVSANTVTIQGNGAQTIDGTNTKVLSAQWQSLMIQSNGTAWFIV